MIIIPERPYGLRFFHEILQQGLEYVEGRQKGTITSLRTPWRGFNQAGIDGIEWGSLVSLASRPGAGKTMTNMQIQRESKKHNPTQDFNILEFQFDMGVNQYAAREFAAQTALDYNVVLSTRKSIENYAIKLMKEYEAECQVFHANGMIRAMITKATTGASIGEAIRYFYDECGNKPALISIDHSWLVRKDVSEREKTATLYNTVQHMVDIKNELPVIIIMISQLLRELEDSSRRNPGSLANYPTSADIFGGDALMQGSDMIAILSAPHKLHIPVYGPKSYKVSPDSIFMHMVKVRNAAMNDEGVLFMRAEFDRGKLVEIPEPDRVAGVGQQVNGGAGWRSPQLNGKKPSADIGDI